MKKTYIAPTFTLLSIAPASIVCVSGVRGWSDDIDDFEDIDYGGIDIDGTIDPN